MKYRLFFSSCARLSRFQRRNSIQIGGHLFRIYGHNIIPANFVMETPGRFLPAVLPNIENRASEKMKKFLPTNAETLWFGRLAFVSQESKYRGLFRPKLSESNVLKIPRHTHTPSKKTI